AVHTAGPRCAPFNAVPTATKCPSRICVTRRTDCWPGPSSPVVPTRRQPVPLSERNTVVSPCESALTSPPMARNPPPASATTALSAGMPESARSPPVFTCCQESPLVETHTAALLPAEPTATNRGGPDRAVATSAIAPRPDAGGVTTRQPWPPCRTQTRGLRSAELPTATRSPDGRAVTPCIAAGPAGSPTSWPVSTVVPARTGAPVVATGGRGGGGGG